MISHLLAALVLASNASGKQIVRTQQGTMVPQVGRSYVTLSGLSASGAVWPEDRGGVTEHLVWDGSALVTTHGYAWTMNGTVPQGASTEFFPSGFSGAGKGYAGPFSSANSYKASADADPFDFTSQGWACVRYIPNDGTTGRLIGANGGAGFTTVGWSIYVGGAANAVMYGTGSTAVTTANSATVGAENVVCAGFAGTTTMVQLNYGQMATLTTGAAVSAATAGPTYIGVWANGTTQPFAGTILEVIAGTGAPSGALFGYYIGYGVAEGLQLWHLTDATFKVGSTRFTAPAPASRTNADGLRIEGSTINYFATPAAPATQSLTLPSGWTLCGWMEGAGSIALAFGTATGTGLPCTVSATATGCSCTFTTTGPGTVTATVTPPATAANVILNAVRQELVPSSGVQTSIDVFRVPSAGNGATRGSGSLDFYPEWASTTSGADRTLVTDLPMAAAAATTANLTIKWINASRVWRLAAGGASVDSAAETFTAGTLRTIGWTYTAGGPACLTVGGVQTCSSGNVTGFTPGAFLTIGSSGYGSSTGPEKNYDDGIAGAVKNVSVGPTRNPGAVATPVACIGDSITFGKGIPVVTPYPTKLAQGLGSGYSVDNHGVGGERVVGGIAVRYGQHVASRYRYVVVLGGFNDLNLGTTAAQIEQHLQGVYDDVRASGATLIPVTTLPSSTLTAGKQTEWLALNVWILAYCSTNGVTCVDAATDFDDGAHALKAAYNSGDNIHPNQTGMDRLGVLIRAAFP